MAIKIAVVNFPHSLNPSGWGEKEYHYKTFYDNLKSGDVVVVEAQGRYSVARFVKYVETTPLHQELKWVVQKVDLEKFELLKEDCEFQELLS